jgi:hypothetical protein
MLLQDRRRRRAAALVVTTLAVGHIPHVAPAQGPGQIRGTVTYTGSLGPVSTRRPLCLCVYTDPQLRVGLWCFILSDNGVLFELPGSETGDYYLLAFLDLDGNERADSNEPYEIYRDRALPPADGVRGGMTDVDLSFGDENVAVSATPSPSPTPSVVPPATATATPTTRPCPGDCDGSGDVTIDEIVTMVNIALGNVQPEACDAGDRDGSHSIEVDEIVAAVNDAGTGCPRS